MSEIMSPTGTRQHSNRARLPLLAIAGRSGIFLTLIGLIALFAIIQPLFLRAANLLGILEAVSVTALLGLGITVSLAVGGFDLSVGSTAAMSVMTAAYAQVVWGWGAVPTVFLVLCVGALIGLFNSLLIVVLRVPDLLATLGTLFLVGGLQLIPSGGNSIATGMTFADGSTANGIFSPAFLVLGRSRLWGLVPLPVIVLGFVALVLWVFMERLRWGRLIYAVGGNELAAHLAGAPTVGPACLARRRFTGCARWAWRHHDWRFFTPGRFCLRFDRLRSTQSSAPQCPRHCCRRDSGWCAAQWSDHAKCALLHTRLHQRCGACGVARSHLSPSPVMAHRTSSANKG
jgi:ribose/xylose/arabinose/galactoside ABC-type transport system permease subunit